MPSHVFCNLSSKNTILYGIDNCACHFMLPYVIESIDPAQIVAIGFATPNPLYFGADPWMGSNMEVPSGLILPPGQGRDPPVSWHRDR